VAWTQALQRRGGPSALVLSRQALPVVAAASQRAPAAARGGYVLSDASAPQAAIVASGSEVALALDAQRQLLNEHAIAVRVVSLPCTSVFERQSAAWRAAVLPDALPVVAVEAGHPEGLRRYAGRHGTVIGIERFGESAGGPALMAHFGFTADAVVRAVLRLLDCSETVAVAAVA